MTFEKILSDLEREEISLKSAYKEITEKDKWKKINYYLHLDNITKEPLADNQLQELNAIVGILQTLYNSKVGSPLSDTSYDILQEMLVDLGMPRLTGSVELNGNSKKVAHSHTNLRGTLDKVYYLDPTERRTNKSRKYLDDWIRSAEERYKKNTGKSVSLSNIKVMLQPKFDGVSCVLEVGDSPIWLTRGDTRNNQASDVSHIMNIFNDVYNNEKPGTGIKFEVMMTEDNKEKINSLVEKSKRYKNSRQIVTSVLNSNEADFKSEYLYPVPLRIMYPGDEMEFVHPKLIEDFPTKICALADRETIRQFANDNKWVLYNGMRFRTDGVVITILDPEIKAGLGRENDINKFEVAYKFTEESAYTRVRDVEFYVSEFGFITPVLVVNDVILKGNTVNHISLSNKERFDELWLCYGDEVKVLYDIIPYVTVDEKCRRIKNGRHIDFVTECPMCHEPLDLNQVQVQCTNRKCPSRIIGQIMNWCSNLRIQNIGPQTLHVLYMEGMLKNGIRSLYKLKKKSKLIESLDGFGKVKTRKMITEIESKRQLKDYELMGSIGIEGLSLKTFRTIFRNIKFNDLIDMATVRNYTLMEARLTEISGIGSSKAKILVDFFKDPNRFKDLIQLMRELRIDQTYGYTGPSKGLVSFSGCRPTPDLVKYMAERGWEASENWRNAAKYLVIPYDDYTSSKVTNAKAKGVPIIALNDRPAVDVLGEVIPELK